MSRKHLFAIIVLLGAAAVAGLLALSRTSTAATPTSSTQITARSRSLDRLEESLRRALAEQSSAVAAAERGNPRTVVRVGVDPQAETGEYQDEGRYEDEDDGDSDASEQNHEHEHEDEDD